MKIKTCELIGPALDWAVGYIRCIEAAEGKVILARDLMVAAIRYGMASTSTDWAQGGPIIERWEISTAKLEETFPDAVAPHPSCWSGHIDGAYTRYGPTPLIAAMRCFVASKLGDEVDIPDALS